MHPAAMTYASSEVCELSGATPRQISHLTTLGVLPPTGSGNHRVWTHDQLRRITLAILLSETGGTTFPAALTALLDLPSPLPTRGWAVLVDGEAVHVASDCDLIAHAGAGPLTLCPLWAVNDRLNARI